MVQRWVVVAVTVAALLSFAGCTQDAPPPASAPSKHVVKPVPATKSTPTAAPATSAAPTSAASPAPSTTAAETPGPSDEPPAPSGPIGPPEDAAPDVVALRGQLASTGKASVEAFHVGHIASDGYIGIGSWWGDPRTFEVEVAPSPILPGTAFFEVDHQAVERPFVEVYEGSVAGSPADLVRLTLSWDWVRGSVRVGDEVYLVRMHYTGNVPGADTAEEALAVATPSLDGFRFYDADGQEPGTCPGGLEEWAPVTVKPLTDLARASAAPVWSRLVVDGDGEFLKTTGKHAFAVLVALTAEMDAIYDYEVGIRHRIVGVHLHSDPAKFRAPGTEVPLAKLAQDWHGHHTDGRDVVHLVTGHDSSFAQANCIGAVGHPEGAFSFTPLPWDFDAPALHSNVYAHELGHLYSAHHHYANHVEAQLATIMIQGYTPGAQPVFGSLEKAVIRGWAEDNL